MEVYQIIMMMMIIYNPINGISLRYIKKNSYVVLEVGFESFLVHH